MADISTRNRRRSSQNLLFVILHPESASALPLPNPGIGHPKGLVVMSGTSLAQRVILASLFALVLTGCKGFIGAGMSCLNTEPFACVIVPRN
jgi:hypothetical protein